MGQDVCVCVCAFAFFLFVEGFLYEPGYMSWCSQLCSLLLQGLVVSNTRVVDVFGSNGVMAKNGDDVFAFKNSDFQF